MTLLNCPPPPRDPVVAPAGAGPAATGRQIYLRLLGWSFAFFSSVRMAAYLPTIAAIWRSGDTSQHSLLTWLTWFGANASMALWLHEHGDARGGSAVWISAGNAAMCAATSLLIVWFRWGAA